LRKIKKSKRVILTKGVRTGLLGSWRPFLDRDPSILILYELVKLENQCKKCEFRGVRRVENEENPNIFR
jgi:hypothetical protein